MPKFAVYYVPAPRDPLYQLGSQLLGYDVRAQAPVTLPAAVRERFAAHEPFADAWVATARPYGFHLTIGDAIDCAWAAIPAVERELEALLPCFDPAHTFRLQRRPDVAIAAWGQPGAHVLVLPFTPSDALLILHTLVAARIHPLGTGSGYVRRLVMGELPDAQVPARAQQTRLLYSPTILGYWYPHFTLLNPYTGATLDEITSLLADLFAPHTELTIGSICLMVQPDESAPWRIYREFPCP